MATADAMLFGADLALTTPAARQPMDATQFRSANWRRLPDQGSNYGSNIMWTTKDIVSQVKDLSTAWLDIPISFRSSVSGTPYTAALAPQIRGWYLAIIDRIQVKSNQAGATFVDGQSNDTYLGAWVNFLTGLDYAAYKQNGAEVGFALDDISATGLTRRGTYFNYDFVFDTASASFVGRMRIPLRYLDPFFATQTLSFGISHDLTVFTNLGNTAQSTPFYLPTGVPAPVCSIGTALGQAGVQSSGQCYLVYRGIELNVAQQEIFNKSLSVPRVQRYLQMRAYNPLLNQTGTQISTNITTSLSHPSCLYIFAMPAGSMTNPAQNNGPFGTAARGAGEKNFSVVGSNNNPRLFEQPLGQALAPGANGGNSYADYELYQEFRDSCQWSSMRANGILDFDTWNQYNRLVAIPLFRQQINRAVDVNQSVDVSFNVLYPAGVAALDFYFVISKERVATYTYQSGAVSVNVSS